MPDSAIFLLPLVGVIAGLLNVAAGGGSALTLPLLIFLGLDGPLANGTNRVAITVQSGTAILGFRAQGLRSLKEPLLLALFAPPGALLGAYAAVDMSDALFRKILALVLVFVAASILLKKKDARTNQDSSLSPGKKFALAASGIFAVGFYGGFIQVGVGFLLMAVLYRYLGDDLALVNSYKVVIVLVFTAPALAVFAWHGLVDWKAGALLALGNSAGGLLGTRLSVKGGNKAVRLVLALAMTIMALRLTGIF